MRKISLASDIDGTLIFRTSEQFSEAVENCFKEKDLAAITSWQDRGNLFGLCTGRCIATIFDLFPNGIQPDFYIASNGSIILDRNRNIIYEAVIEKEDIRDLYKTYKNSTIFSVFHTESRDTLYTSKYIRNSGAKEMLTTSLEDIGDRKLYSISLVFTDNHTAEEVCRDVNKNYQSLEAFQNKDSLDIVKRGCSKGQGILFVKEYLQIEMMAGIGDSFNDMPMLQAACPSFTFSDSPKMLRDNATYVVDSVAEAIELLNSKKMVL